MTDFSDSTFGRPPTGEVVQPSEGISPLQAAELQDQLMMATMDLERLMRLVNDASDTLMGHLYGATGQLERALRVLSQHPEIDLRHIHMAMEHMAAAITGMQFQDMSSQLLTHTLRRLRNCSDRLAYTALGEDEDGATVVEEAPLRPNPVTQDEMDAGSIELF